MGHMRGRYKTRGNNRNIKTHKMHTSAPLSPPKVHNQSKANAKTKTKKRKHQSCTATRSMVHQSISPPPGCLYAVPQKTKRKKRKTQNTKTRKQSQVHRKLPVLKECPLVQRLREEVSMLPLGRYVDNLKLPAVGAWC